MEGKGAPGVIYSLATLVMTITHFLDHSRAHFPPLFMLQSTGLLTIVFAR